MFGIFNNSNGGRTELGNKAKSNYYATGAKSNPVPDRYILVDAGTEFEVDKLYIDSLLESNSVKYDGVMEDTYGAMIYMYIFTAPAPTNS